MRDGREYRAVKIGEQTWMAENLSYKTSKSQCYDNDESYCKEYGRLYDWNAAMTACPKGWHLPDTAEWNVLMAAAGGGVRKTDAVGEGNAYYEGAGGKLKSKTGWNN